MLERIHPLLSGDLLKHLSDMGHSDAVAVVDAHFPAAALASRLIRLPATTSPDALSAVRSVLPLDDSPAVDLMSSADQSLLDIQRELLEAAGVGVDGARFVDRFDFYDAARQAFLIVQTGETRPYGCAIVRKGLVGHVLP